MGPLVATVVVVYRMTTVQIGAVGNAVGITIPKGAGVVGGGQPERVTMFSQPVEIRILREPGAKVQVLRLEDKVRGRSIKQYLIAFCDSEREWLRLVIEFQLRLLTGATVAPGTR